MSVTPASGHYEMWVTRIRAWQRDPMTPLDDLPALDLSHFSANSLSRFVRHLTRAVDAVTDDWSTHFTELSRHARSPHELAEALVGSRKILFRAVVLARHPGLPEKVRQALDEAVTAKIHQLQADLEKNMSRTVDATRSDATTTDQLVDVFRQNPLTAVLDPAYGDGTQFLKSAGIADPAQQPPAPPQQPVDPPVDQPAPESGFRSLFRRRRR